MSDVENETKRNKKTVKKAKKTKKDTKKKEKEKEKSEKNEEKIEILNKKRKKPDEENEPEENVKEEETKQKNKKKKLEKEDEDENNKLIKEIEDKMLNEIIEYLKTGAVPKKNNSTSYSYCYNNVCKIVDKKDDNNVGYLIEYHNKVIYDFIKYCHGLMCGKSKVELIDSFIEYTKKINHLIYSMKRIFDYLDRKSNIINNETLCKNAINIYKNNFFNDFQNDVYKELNKLIKKDRDGKIEERPKIKFILKMVEALDFTDPQIIKDNNKLSWISEKSNNINNNNNEYKNYWFENYFSTETNIYAEAKAKSDIQNLSAPEYINYQLKYLEEEEMRKTEYINPIYYSQINNINYKYLIGKNAKELGEMDTGIPHMFTTKKYGELKNAYKLMSLYQDNSYKPLEVISSAFTKYIINRGNEISNNKDTIKDPKKLIPALVGLKKEMDKIVEDCFDNSKLFKATTNNAFRDFMKKDIYAKQLSNYIDFCMKIGFKGKSDDEVNKSLDEILDLYKYLNSKIVFHAEADIQMSNRLIQNSYSSIYSEKQFISKLSLESGVNNIDKMTQMMKDFEYNKNEIDQYKASSENKGMPNGIKFNILVVSHGAWNINTKMMENIEIPRFLQSCLQDFEQYYLKKYDQRKLNWCLGPSRIEIQYLCFTNKNISLSTLPQFLTLLQLEKNNKLTLGKISELIGYKIDYLLNDISGLVFNPSFNPYMKKDKGLILGTFDEKTKEFKETDEIYFNKNFICPRQRFNTLPLTSQNKDANINQIEKENETILKKYQENILESTIARIMKSQKGNKVQHTWLIGETARQIYLFKAQPHQIKEVIEKLIAKEIIKRNNENRDCYEYIA